MSTRPNHIHFRLDDLIVCVCFPSTVCKDDAENSHVTLGGPDASGAQPVAILKLVPDSVLTIFEKTGAYLTGHFRLTSGLHSNEYLQCALVLQHPEIAERFGRDLAERMAHATVVLAPAIGGLIIGHEVARAMGARFVFAERENG